MADANLNIVISAIDETGKVLEELLNKFKGLTDAIAGTTEQQRKSTSESRTAKTAFSELTDSLSTAGTRVMDFGKSVGAVFRDIQGFALVFGGLNAAVLKFATAPTAPCLPYPAMSEAYCVGNGPPTVPTGM